jgi:hypothetical protein
MPHGRSFGIGMLSRCAPWLESNDRCCRGCVEKKDACCAQFIFPPGFGVG